MIYVHTQSASALSVRQTEILRYLGYGKAEPDAEVAKRIESIKQEVLGSVSLRACLRLLPVSVAEHSVDFGFFVAESTQLARNLSGCKRVLLFAATLGTEVDRIIGKYSRFAQSSAVIAQAVGTAAVESWCDLLLLDVAKSLEKEGAFLRPRFSPGYGDFQLSHQKDLFSVLDAARKIGVSLTDALLMTPTKSVTAVAGISETDEACALSGCEACLKRKECLYARG